MPFSESPPRVALVYSDDVWRYEMRDTHPLLPVRWKRTFDLMVAAGLVAAPNVSILPHRPASAEDLELCHSPSYVYAEKAPPSGLELPGGRWYGFGPGYNPGVIGRL